MSEQVRVRAGSHHAAIGLLILASVVFLPVFAKGQCKEPINPKAEVPAAKLNGTKLAAAAAVPAGKSTGASDDVQAAADPGSGPGTTRRSMTSVRRSRTNWPSEL